MLTNRTPAFRKIREYLDTLPVIDTHEHGWGLCPEEKEFDILGFFTCNCYYHSDLVSASHDYTAEPPPVSVWSQTPLTRFIADSRQDFNARYEAWRKYHDRIAHTAYARCLIEGLRACWGLKGVDRKSLLAVQERVRAERNQAFQDRMYRKYGIKAIICNVDLCAVMSGQHSYNREICRFVLDLPGYHDISSEAAARKPQLEEALGHKINTLDDYLEAFTAFLDKAVAFGIVGLKDQTAYRRDLGYGNPGRGEAEAVFSRIMSHPRDTFGTEQVRPLDDYLFHRFLDLAARRRLPVQIHTGHMAGIRNDIRKANAALMTGVFELHQDVVFDLFHGNWPYLGEYLFLAKNYPNVTLDMCWVNAIDPLYCVEFYRRATMTLPASKISGFGGDTSTVESQIGYLILAKDNIACALAGLMDQGWLGLTEAQALARAWLFDNPKHIFNLKGVEIAE